MWGMRMCHSRYMEAMKAGKLRQTQEGSSANSSKCAHWVYEAEFLALTHSDIPFIRSHWQLTAAGRGRVCLLQVCSHW